MLTGGQDDIWDRAAGLLIAQETGLLVTMVQVPGANTLLRSFAQAQLLHT